MSSTPPTKCIVKSKKWYGRFWPPERRKIKLMQALLDSYALKIEKQVTDTFIYGRVSAPDRKGD